MNIEECVLRTKYKAPLDRELHRRTDSGTYEWGYSERRCMYANRPQISQQPQQLLTPDDVAALLGVSRLFIIRQSRAGRIPSVKIGKVYRYRANTIESWLSEQESALVERAM